MVSRRQFFGVVGGLASAVAVAGLAARLSSPSSKSPESDFDGFARPRGLACASDVGGYVARACAGMGLMSAAVPGASAAAAKPTPMPVRLRYALVDASLVGESTTFDEMWSDPEVGPLAHIVQYETIATLLDVGDPDCYVLLGDPSVFNSFGGSVGYVAFTTDDDNGEAWDGCSYDAETGVVRVARSNYLDGDGNVVFRPLRVQFMVRVDTTSELSCDVPVRIVCEDDDVRVLDTTSVRCVGHSLEIAVPLCEPEYVERVLADDVAVFVSGTDFRQDALSQMLFLDEDGILHISQMGLVVPGIEVLVRPRARDDGGLLSARVAYGIRSWSSMNIWPWGYVTDSPALDQFCNSNRIFSYDGSRGGTLPMEERYVMAFDANSWDAHPVVKGYIQANFFKLAPYTYNLHFMMGADDYDGEYIDIDTSPTSTVMSGLYNYASNNEYLLAASSWNEVAHLQYDDPNDFDVWAHWLMLPSCDIANTFYNNGSLDKEFWTSIKNVRFDNETMLWTPAEDDAQYLSCVLANAVCIHSEEASGSVTGSGIYVGRIYGRVLNVDRESKKPSVVIAFHTDGFGLNGKNQAAQAVIRFQLGPDTGHVKVSKSSSV